MRYYKYGKVMEEKESEEKGKGQTEIIGRFGELVIDEDTIYEIDEECLKCREKN